MNHTQFYLNETRYKGLKWSFKFRKINQYVFKQSARYCFYLSTWFWYHKNKERNNITRCPRRANTSSMYKLIA